jgi:hypothetical protein
MPLVSINQIVEWTEKTRATVMKKIGDLPKQDGPKQAKLYNSAQAMEAIYGREVREDGTVDESTMSNAEANRLLTIARRKQIDLEMEVLKKQRPRIEDVIDIFGAALDDVAGIIKGSELSEDRKKDIMARLKEAMEQLKSDE